MADDETRDDNILDLYEIRRRAGMRSFHVIHFSGAEEIVFAHFYDNTNPPGHLNFITIEPSGRRAIHRSINARSWMDVLEIDDAAASSALDETLEIEKGVLQPDRPTKKTRVTH